MQGTSIEYATDDRQVSWWGVRMSDENAFSAFLTTDVRSRLRDEEGSADFETHLRGLATTGFSRDSLATLLEADVPEERDWAIGEAMAEAYLSHEHKITWPWNMERDKRTPKASLPGADLIGFKVGNGSARLALGEVKTSTDSSAPPNVMSGRSGMTHQLDELAKNLSILVTILKWLLPRCKGTEHEATFNVAVTAFLESGNKEIALFGVLLRDTQADERDLRARGQSLAGTIVSPTTCQLIAVYLPCKIADLPSRISEDES
jgi:hypothetical protein